MSEAKTVSCTSSLDLLAEQARDVDAMRSTLLSFRKDDPNAARKALQNVTVLRVYHQLERIVRYTEMIDRLEDRIYQSIDAKLDCTDPDDSEIWLSLIPIQERLQKMMIDSHKLLEPYLNMEQLTTFEIPQQEDPANSFTSMILDQESREKVRTASQELLATIATLDSIDQLQEISVESQENSHQSEVQSKAAEALAELEGADNNG